MADPKAPRFAPMLCEAAEHPPEGGVWRYEVKLDGYRTIAVKSAGRVQLWSRNGKDFNRRFREVAQALSALPDETAIDGEIVAFDSDGKPSFALLQDFHQGAIARAFYAFDLLMLRGRDIRALALDERRKRLSALLKKLPPVILYSETFDAPIGELKRIVREHGLEGIVAKRADSQYRSGRSADWVKWRANKGQELVIGGYVPSATRQIDSILVGYYKGRTLVYAGRVRAGLVAESRRGLAACFETLRAPRCPFGNLPERAKGRWGEGLTPERMNECRWLKPRIVAAIEFLEWTPEFRLRHPSFVGLRSDKDPRAIVLELPSPRV